MAEEAANQNSQAATMDQVDTGTDAASIQQTIDRAFDRLPYATAFKAGTLGQVPQVQNQPTPGVHPELGKIIPPPIPWVRTENSTGTTPQGIAEPAPITADMIPKVPAAAERVPITDTPAVTEQQTQQADDTKTTEKPVDASTVADDVAPQGNEAQQKWNELKAAAKEAAVLKQKLSEFEGTRAEFESLQRTYADAIKEREGIEVELYKTRVVASQKFKDQVVKPFDAVEASALAIAKESEIDGEALIGAIVKGDKKAMLELTASLHPYDQTKVFGMYDKMREITEARNNLLADSRAQYEADIKEQEQQRVESSAKLMAERQTALDTVVPAFQQKISTILPKEEVDNLINVREELGNFDSWPEHYKVYGTAAATVLPKILTAYESLQAQLKDAQTEINQLRGGSPKIGAGTPAPAPVVVQVPTVPKTGTTLSQLAKEGTNNILASLGLPTVRL